MSTVRVLVGTRKGAFILTSDGKREKWDISGPHFAGWEMYHLKGSPAGSESHLCIADQRMVWPGHSAIRRRRQDLAPAGNASRRRDRARRHAEGREQQICLRHVGRDRRADDHAPVLRRQTASVGVQAGVASGAVADRSRHGLRWSRRRGDFPLDRRREELERDVRIARPRHRPQVAAGRGRHVPAHHHS